MKLIKKQFKFANYVLSQIGLFSLYGTSFVARFSFEFTRCSLLVVKSLVPRWSNHSLLVAKFARYLLQIHSFLAAEITRHSLQMLLSVKIHSLLVKFAYYLLRKALVAKNYWLLVSKIARYSWQELPVTENPCHLL